uniref:IMV membrane protein n=1 Tax=Rousettus bat poxvirus TaxID=3141933 RepID=A0AAU7E1N8_9POXV
MSCYVAILKSIGGLALFQVANNAIELIKHLLLYFYEQKIRANSFGFVVIKIGLSMLMYLMLGMALLYVANHVAVPAGRDAESRSDAATEVATAAADAGMHLCTDHRH